MQVPEGRLRHSLHKRGVSGRDGVLVLRVITGEVERDVTAEGRHERGKTLHLQRVVVLCRDDQRGHLEVDPTRGLAEEPLYFIQLAARLRAYRTRNRMT